MEVSFQWKNPDFLLKNPDLLIRNLDFLLKNVDFISKTSPKTDDDAEQLCTRHGFALLGHTSASAAAGNNVQEVFHRLGMAAAAAPGVPDSPMVASPLPEKAAAVTYLGGTQEELAPAPATPPRRISPSELEFLSQAGPSRTSVEGLEALGVVDEKGQRQLVAAAAAKKKREEKRSAKEAKEAAATDGAQAAPAAATAIDAAASAAAMAGYRVVTRGVLRAGVTMDSAKVGELEVGDVLRVLETSVLENGVLRVRCEAGWTSEASGSGVRILEPMTAQQLEGEDAKKKEQRAVAVTAAAAAAEMDLSGGSSPGPQPPGYSFGSSGVRVSADLEPLALALAASPAESRSQPQQKLILNWLSTCTWTEHRHPTAGERQALLSCISIREAPTGTVLCREGEAPGAAGAQNALLFVVLLGELGLFMGNVPQKRIGPGMEIGEEALVMSDEDCVRPFTVKSLRPTVVVTVGPRKDYMVAIAAAAAAAAAGFQEERPAPSPGGGKGRFGLSKMFGR